MPGPRDLDRRLQAAAGPEPDTAMALDGVTARIRRRARRAVLILAAMVLVTGAVAVVFVVADRQPSDNSSVFVGQPPETTGSEPNDDVPRLRQIWRAQKVGMSGGFLPSSGRLVTSADDVVLAADGFGPGRAFPNGRITALERGSGGARWTADLDGPAFLQGAAGGTAVANTQYERIVGFDVGDGTTRWEISLSELGLEGYGAVTSAVAEPVSAIGLSTQGEGDVRPPVILGVDTRTGQVAWTTPLVDGTDLMFGTPPVRDGATVFASTLSHPGSAAEKVAHLIELANGSIRWTAGMGGGLAFSFHPAVINGPYVHLPADSEVLTVGLADGRRRWSRPGSGPVLVGGQLWIMSAESSLERLDAATGDLIGTVDSPVEDPALLLDLGNDLLGIASATEFAAVDASGEVRLRGSWSGDLVDVPLFDGDVIFVATAAQALAAYSIEPS